MEQFIATFIAFVVVMMGMSVGVVFMGRAIQGSCGGIGAGDAEDEDSGCDFCGNSEEDQQSCKRRKKRAEAKALRSAIH